jgi:hypothetical protein
MPEPEQSKVGTYPPLTGVLYPAGKFTKAQVIGSAFPLRFSPRVRGRHPQMPIWRLDSDGLGILALTTSSKEIIIKAN